MKRLSELLFVQVQELYDYRERGMKSSWFAILATIKKEQPIDFKTLASKNNISSPAVSQTIKELEKLSLVSLEIGEDRRSRLISITERANEILENIVPDLIEIEKALSELLCQDANIVIEALNRVEHQLREKPLIKMLEAEKKIQRTGKKPNQKLYPLPLKANKIRCNI